MLAGGLGKLRLAQNQRPKSPERQHMRQSIRSDEQRSYDEIDVNFRKRVGLTALLQAPVVAVVVYSSES